MTEMTRKIYLQSDDAAGLLRNSAEHQALQADVVTFSGSLPASDAAQGVIVGTSPAIFTKSVEEAVAKNRARIIYVLGPAEQQIPAAVEAIPVFCYLSSPLQLSVLRSAVKAAFENLDLSRSQAN